MLKIEEIKHQIHIIILDRKIKKKEKEIAKKIKELDEGKWNSI